MKLFFCHSLVSIGGNKQIETDFNQWEIILTINSTLNSCEGVLLNMGILKKVIVTLLLLIVGVFLIRIYWTDIVPVLGESLKILT